MRFTLNHINRTLQRLLSAAPGRKGRKPGTSAGKKTEKEKGRQERWMRIIPAGVMDRLAAWTFDHIALSPKAFCMHKQTSTVTGQHPKPHAATNKK